MCANRGGPVKPAQVKVQFSVVPSALSSARKVPLAPLAFGGTSLKVDSSVEKRRGPPPPWLFACVEELLSNRTVKAASAALMHRFFISSSFQAPRTRRTQGARGLLTRRPAEGQVSPAISARRNDCRYVVICRTY